MSGGTMLQKEDLISFFLSIGISQLAFIVPFFQIRECEENVGSALTNGYLFAAATPLSISGSLGVLKQGFTFWLLGGLFPKVTRHYRRTLLSKKFRYRGEVSSLLNIEKNTERYNAESRFDDCVKELGVKNPHTLKVTHKDKHWKAGATVSSLLAVSCSITPYIHAIYNLRGTRNLGVAISFPLVRAFGSLLITVSIQYILRYKLLSIMRKRIIFKVISDVAKKAGGVKLNNLQNVEWTKEKGSGHCLRTLEDHFKHTPVGAYGGYSRVDTETGTLMEQLTPSTSMGGFHDNTAENMQHSVRTELKNLMDKYRKNRKLEQTWEVMRQMFLLIGMVFSVYGYFGSFVLVQGSDDQSLAPITWLLVELALMVARSIIWASDPKFDEATAVELSYQQTWSSLPSSIPPIGDSETKKYPVLKAKEIREKFPNRQHITLPSHISIYYIIPTDYKDPAKGVLHLAIVDGHRVEVFREDQGSLSIFYNGSIKRGHIGNVTISVTGADRRRSSGLVDAATMSKIRDHYIDCFRLPWDAKITMELKWNLIMKKTPDAESKVLRHRRGGSGNTSDNDSDDSD